MRTKGIVLSLLVFFSISCDISKPLIIDREKYPMNNQCGTISVGGFSFGTLAVIICKLNGEYHINTDSLKIEAFSVEDTLVIDSFLLNNEEFTINKMETKGEVELSFSCNLLPTVPYQRTTSTILLLPSNFITCESKPIITDTIRIQLKN